MTQDERWLAQYKDVMAFMESKHRRPSKFIDEERGLRNWVRHQQKLVNKGDLKEGRVELFMQLIELGESNRHVNQYK